MRFLTSLFIKSVLKIRGSFTVWKRLDYKRSPIFLQMESLIEWDLRLHSCRKEPDTIQWLEENLNPGDVLFDIGANVGAYSLVAAKGTKEATRVFAFEPVAVNYRQLVKNVIYNDCLDRVTPLPIAFSDQTGPAFFYLTQPLAGGAEHPGLSGSVFSDKKMAQSVFCFEMDKAIGWLNLPIPQLIKLDVDGAEEKVLVGGHDTLRRPEVRSILMEIDVRYSQVERLVSLVVDAGFQVVARTPHGQGHVFNYLFFRSDDQRTNEKGISKARETPCPQKVEKSLYYKLINLLEKSTPDFVFQFLRGFKKNCTNPLRVWVQLRQSSPLWMPFKSGVTLFHFRIESLSDMGQAESDWASLDERMGWLQPFTEEGDVFYDVGAGAGMFAVRIAHSVPKVRVFAFESSADGYWILSENVRRNLCGERVTLFPVSLSNNPGIMNAKESCCSGREVEGGKSEPLQSQVGFDLDSFIERMGLPWPHHIQLAKNSFTGEFVQGALKTLRRPELRTILCGTSHLNELDRGLVDIIKSIGFRDVSVGKNNFFCMFSRPFPRGASGHE